MGGLKERKGVASVANERVAILSIVHAGWQIVVVVSNLFACRSDEVLLVFAN